MSTFLLVIWFYMGMLDAIIMHTILKYGHFCVYLLPKCFFCIFSRIPISNELNALRFNNSLLGHQANGKTKCLALIEEEMSIHYR